MKRLFCILLALGLLMSVAGSVYGDGGTGLVPNADYRCKTYSWGPSIVQGGSGYTVARNRKLVPSTTIGTSDLILGFSVVPIDTATNIDKGAVAALYDDANTVLTGSQPITGFIDEIEVGANERQGERWFPYPLNYTNGLVIATGQGDCIVTIFYVDI